MRVLAFTPASRSYELLFQALLYSPKELKKEDLKPHVKLRKKFRAIGKETVEKMTQGGVEIGSMTLARTVEGGEVILDETAYRLLVALFDAAVPGFSKAASEEVDGCVEWLAAIPEVTEEFIAGKNKPKLDESVKSEGEGAEA